MSGPGTAACMSEPWTVALIFPRMAGLHEQRTAADLKGPWTVALIFPRTAGLHEQRTAADLKGPWEAAAGMTSEPRTAASMKEPRTTDSQHLWQSRRTPNTEIHLTRAG